jgi:hypothetical protein
VSQNRAAVHCHDQLDAFRDSSNKAAIEAANLALRTAVLINGGAAVSVLAFIGGLVSQGKLAFGPQLAQAANSLLWFAFGAFAAGMGVAFAYFTTYCITGHAQNMVRKWEHPYFEEGAASRRWRHGSTFFRILAMVCGFGASGMFVGGIIEVRNAIIHFG